MKSIKYTAFLILFSFVYLYGASDDIKVMPAGDELIEVEPKQTVTTVFRMTNNTSSHHEFVSEVDLPEGWKLITQNLPFQLDENESDIRLLSFYVPQNITVGKYPVTYRVRSREFPSLSDEYTIFIHVLSVYELNIQILESPIRTVAGDTYHVDLMILNKSNISSDVTLDVISEPQLPTTVSLNHFHLEVGESKTVSVQVQTDSTTKKYFTHKLDLIARFNEDGKNIFRTMNYVDVIPQIPEEEDQYHRIPVNMSVKQVFQTGETTNYGVQFDIHGRGTLDEEGHKNVEFRLRAPDLYEKSVLAERDEYFFSYINGRFILHLGDRHYTLSRLTEFRRYGRGGEFQYHFNGLLIGAFYQKTRWLNPREKQIASFIQYAFWENQFVRFNYLNKKNEDGRTNIYSLQTTFHPIHNMEIETEYALGRVRGDNKNAFQLQIHGNHQILNYYLDIIHTDANFPGYYQNMKLTSGGVSFNVFRNLRVEANLRKYRDRYELRQDYATVSNQYTHFSLRYRFSRNTHLRMGLLKTSREDLQPTPRFNYEEHSGQIEWLQNWKQFNLTATANFGQTNNRLLEQKSWMERYTLSGRLQFSPYHSIRGYLYYDNNRRYSNERERILTVGLNTDFRILENIFFNLNYQNQYTPDDIYSDRDVFDLHFQYTFREHHELILKARHTILRNTMNDKEMAFMVEYNYRLGIPTSRKKSIGVVRGQILDAKTLLPIQNVIVRINGSVTITDQKGQFVFSSLVPKTYFLRIDKSNIGLDKVTLQKTPIEVEVKGGEEQFVNISIISAARVTGQVMVYQVVNDTSDHFSLDQIENHMDEFYVAGNGNNGRKETITNEKTMLVEDYGLSNTVIDLMRDDEVHRRLTDKNGRFVFDEIRPGKWTLKIYDFNLPDYYRLEREEFEIYIQPGETQNIMIAVLPVRRQIQFQEGENTIIKLNGNDQKE